METRPLVIVGPSGVGKGTLIAKIQEGFAGASIKIGTWDGEQAQDQSTSQIQSVCCPSTGQLTRGFRQDALASQYLTPRGNRDLVRWDNKKQQGSPNQMFVILLMCKNRNDT